MSNVFVSNAGTVTISQNGFFYTQPNSILFIRYKRIGLIATRLKCGGGRRIIVGDERGKALLSIPESDFQDFNALENVLQTSWQKFWGRSD